MSYYRNYRNYPTYQKKEKTYKQYLHLTYKEISEKENHYKFQLKQLEEINDEFYKFFHQHNSKVDEALIEIDEIIFNHIKRKQEDKSLKKYLNEFKSIFKELIDFHDGKSFIGYMFTSEKKFNKPYLKLYDLIINKINTFDDALIEELKNYADNNFKYDLPIFKKKFKINKAEEIIFDTTKISSCSQFKQDDSEINHFLGRIIYKHEKYYRPHKIEGIENGFSCNYRDNWEKRIDIGRSPFVKDLITKTFDNDEQNTMYHDAYWNFDFNDFYKTLSDECITFIARLFVDPFESGYMLFNIKNSETYEFEKKIMSFLEPIQKAKSIIEKRYNEQQNKIKRAKDETAKHKAHSYAYQEKTRELAEEIKREIKSQLSKFKECPYCENDLGEIPHADHIYPVSKGGLSTKENMVYICQNCNSSKSDKTLNTFIKLKGLDRDKVEANLELLGKDY